MLRRSLTALCALALPAAILAGCGGIPGNAVVQVDGTNIEKSTFDHWMTIAAKSNGATAKVPVPPDFTICIADARKAAAKPAEGQPRQTDAQLKTTCETQYNQLRDSVLQFLVTYEWYKGEAEELGIEVTDAQVEKAFAEQKKQSFPKEADYKKFLEDSGQTEADLKTTVRWNLLSTKIRDHVIKGKDKVTTQEAQAYYDKNKARFATPETRDLRIVLTKSEARADEARQAIEGGQSWSSVAKEYSTDAASKNQGGKLLSVARGQQEKAFDEAIFAAERGELAGPVKTQFGWYVFEVTKINEADQQTFKEAEATIKQLVASEEQQKALDTFVKDFQERWKDQTECRDGFVTQNCENAPDPTPTPTPGAAGSPAPTPAD